MFSTCTTFILLIKKEITKMREISSNVSFSCEFLCLWHKSLVFLFGRWRRGRQIWPHSKHVDLFFGNWCLSFMNKVNFILKTKRKFLLFHFWVKCMIIFYFRKFSLISCALNACRNKRYACWVRYKWICEY